MKLRGAKEPTVILKGSFLVDTETYTIRIAELSVDKSELSGRCHKGNQQKTKVHAWICSKVQLIRSSGAVKGRYRRAADKRHRWKMLKI